MAISEADLVNQKIRTGTKIAIKQANQDLIDIYKDNWFHIIEQELKDQLTEQTFQKYSFLITRELNLIKRVVNELSMVYKDPAERKAVTTTQTTPEAIEGEPAPVAVEVQTEDPNYAEALKDTNKDQVMQAANKYTNLTNQTVIRVTYRDNKLDYDLLNFNNVEIFTDPADWKNIIAVKHYFGLDLPNADNRRSPNMKFNDQDFGLTSQSVQQYHSAKVWVKEDISKDGIIEDGDIDGMLKAGNIYTVNVMGDAEIVEAVETIPYQDEIGGFILPFVLVPRLYPVDQLLDFTSGNDLFDLNINVAILMVYLNTLEKYQSFKQLVINTEDPASVPNGIRLGPAESIVNPIGKEGGGSVDVLDLMTDTEKKVKTITARIQSVLTGYNLSPANFTMSASPQSGFALKISNIGKLESRQEQVPTYRRAEHEIFGIERVIWNFHQPTKPISKEAEFFINFAEITFPKSPQEKQTEFTFLKNE